MTKSYTPIIYLRSLQNLLGVLSIYTIYSDTVHKLIRIISKMLKANVAFNLD